MQPKTPGPRTPAVTTRAETMLCKLSRTLFTLVTMQSSTSPLNGRKVTQPKETWGAWEGGSSLS